MIADLAIIVPTLNERDNVAVLVERLRETLAGIDWEVIFVDDDSTDGTRDVLYRLARADDRVRFIHRVGRRGLSSACVEGMSATTAPLIAVMDSDLQHDEALLPKMYAVLAAGETDLVVGSRYMEGGGTGDWGAARRWMSRFATGLSRAVIGAKLTDPMSGFFMMTRDTFERAQRRISGHGFKILLDLVASLPEPPAVRELPYRFRTRVAGESKLDTLIIYEFLLLLFDKTIGRVIPVKFLMFVTVGALGALLHLSILGVGYLGLQARFAAAQATATLAAMTLNFFLNNRLTYRDRRLKGARFLRGLLLFTLVCAAGAVASIQLAEYLHELSAPWWLAGLLGAVVGAVWNFAVSSTFVWGNRR